MKERFVYMCISWKHFCNKLQIKLLLFELKIGIKKSTKFPIDIEPYSKSNVKVYVIWANVVTPIRHNGTAHFLLSLSVEGTNEKVCNIIHLFKWEKLLQLDITIIMILQSYKFKILFPLNFLLCLSLQSCPLLA